MSETTHPDSESEPERLWKPLTRVQRRVVGVLVEKSKTTPDVYPMTVNSICAGSNQKSNRKPKMELTTDEVESTLEELRLLGAVIEVIGDGRVPKYKHRLYEWLAIEKKEMAVMGELLLRGEQTLGDLRARASRMNPIADQAELKELVQSLLDKDLMIEITPPGRGQIVSHNLYLPEELEKVHRNVQAEKSGAPAPESTSSPSEIQELRDRVDQLEQIVTQLRLEVDEIKS